MKYCLKPSSRFIDIPGPNKMIFFDDEKSLISFFYEQMVKDLVNPNSKNERLNSWQLNKYKYGINPLDITCVYSILVSQKVDFIWLSYPTRIRKMLKEHMPQHRYTWSITCRLRSLPCNYTLYTLEQQNNGKILKNVRWGNFWRMAKKNDLFKDISLSYEIPEKQ
jgi:hypothetical protein